MEDRFPTIWMPSSEQRDLRTLLRDRRQWVKVRTRVQNTLQAIALDRALRHGHALWSPAGQKALQALALSRYSSQRRDELLHLYVQLQKRIKELDRQVEEEAKRRPQALRLLTHPGVQKDRDRNELLATIIAAIEFSSPPQLSGSSHSRCCRLAEEPH
jgi:transposase